MGFFAGGGSRYSGYSDFPHLLQGGDLGAFLPITVRVTPSLSGGRVFTHDRVNDTKQSLRGKCLTKIVHPSLLWSAWENPQRAGNCSFSLTALISG